MQIDGVTTSGVTQSGAPSGTVAKMLDYAKRYVGSYKFSGMCQSFVAHCYEAGFGSDAAYCASAKVAYNKWHKTGTYTDKKPPAGAAVFFFSSSQDYWHVALSAGYDKSAGAYMIYDPCSERSGGVLYHSLDKAIRFHNTGASWYSRTGVSNDRGYLGWGWEGDLVATGTAGTYGSASAMTEKNTTVHGGSSGTFGGSSSSSAKKTDGGSAKMTPKKTTTITDSQGKPVADLTEATVEITSVVDNSSVTAKTALTDLKQYTNGRLSLLIQKQDGTLITPLITGTVSVTRYRTSQPAKLTFSCVDIEGVTYSPGDAVALRWDNADVFYGYIFKLSSSDATVKITAYDQLRYFKNMDSLVYSGKYSELVDYLCRKYGLDEGTIEDTGYDIPKRIEQGSLFDICATASTLTLLSQKRHFILYDDFGKICLRDINNMMLNLYVDGESLEKWDYSESIDSGVANKVIVAVDDKTTGVRNLYSADSPETIKKWGTLTKYETQSDVTPEMAMSRAKSLLSLYNRPDKKLKLQNVIGDPAVRGGSSFIVELWVGNGTRVRQFAVVDQVEHRFDDNRHLMDMTVFGGELTA